MCVWLQQPDVPFLCSDRNTASHSRQGQRVLGKAASETGPRDRGRLFQLHLQNKKVAAELLCYMFTTVAYHEKPTTTLLQFSVLRGFAYFLNE